jgi:hypothetical protein
MDQQLKSNPILRWILFLPAACFAAWLTWFVVSVVNRITMGRYIDPDSFLSRVFIEWISHAAMGAAFVYIGARVAPNHRTKVAYALSCLSLVGAGFLLFPAFLIADYWAVWSGFSLIIGVGATAYSVSIGEINIDT